MSWDTPSGQSFLSHLSSPPPQSLDSSPQSSLSLNTPSTLSRLDHFASSLDMVEVELAWDAGCDFSWEAVKPRKTPRVVRHYLQDVRDVESGLPFTFPLVDDRRQKYRNVSPTHNIFLLKLGYINEDSIFPPTPAAGDEWNSGPTTDFGNTNGTMRYASGDARFNGGVANDFGGADVNGYGGGDALNGGACNNCGQEGHFARECPEPRKTGACYNCGEEDHAKADCTKPRVFTGTCRTCNQEGHQARDCPTKPKVCKNCKEEGHDTIDCKNKMKIDMNNIADKTQDEAWALLTKASDERDLDDFKEAVKMLVKAIPSTTYVELEQEFRKRSFDVYLIAMEKDTGPTWTNVDLQGNIAKKYAVGYFYSDKPQRPKLQAKWPKDAADNLERLANAGTPMDRGVDLCNNCGEVGHVKRNCTQDPVSVEAVVVKCMLCDEEGHRVRDCPQERPKPRGPRACKICESTEHMAKDCDKREKRTCRKCGSEDHIAKECDVINDEEGHLWKECPKPKDWARVKCRNCGEMGHTVKRCKQPIKEELQASMNGGTAAFDAGSAGPASGDVGASGSTGNDWDNADAGAGASGDWANGAASGGQNDWEKTDSAPAVSAGGW